MTTTESIAHRANEIARLVAAITADKTASIVVDGIEEGLHVSQIRWNVNQFVEHVEAEWPAIADTFPIRECAITAAEDVLRAVEAAIGGES